MLTQIFFSDCENVSLKSPAEDISKRCARFATAQYCKNNGYVRKRCQASCGVCKGSKNFHSYHLVMIISGYLKGHTTVCFIFSAFRYNVSIRNNTCTNRPTYNRSRFEFHPVLKQVLYFYYWIEIPIKISTLLIPCFSTYSM